MKNNKQYTLPVPITDVKEEDSLDKLTKRYEKLIEPSKLSKFGDKVIDVLPEQVKKLGTGVRNTISEQELYIQSMKIVADGFKIVEEHAAKFTISEKSILKKLNEIVPHNNITSLNEVCLARGYDISKLVSSYKTKDIGLAFAEGGITGIFGFAGLPFNLVLSTFLYYRAVQSVAMYYGYDVKNDANELVISSEVFMSALSPGRSDTNGVTDIIGKVMLISKATAVKQAAKKSWGEMASRGGIELLITQMRALANISAKKALEKAGKKGLEQSIFKDVFEQIGRKLALKTVQRAVPVISGLIGACFDTAQMNKVLEYADVFYNKRYILEKQYRINCIVGVINDEIIIENMEEPNT